MNAIKYELKENTIFEQYDDCAILAADIAEKVICIGMFECEVLNIILENDLDSAVRILNSRYDGADIRSDIIEFCEKLCMLDVMQKTCI